MTTTSTRKVDSDSSADASGVPWDSRTVRLVLSSTLLAPLGVPLVSPALPAIRDAFGVTDAEASLLVSAYFVVGIALSPFVGALADRIGRRRVLAGSLLVFGLTGGVTAFAPSFDAVVALRAVQGTAAAGIFVSTVTVIGDAFDGPQRNSVLGVNTAVLSAGAALFPIVGGLLVAVAWNAPFLTYFAAVPLAVAVYLWLDEPGASGGRRPTWGRAYARGVLRDLRPPATLSLYVATFAGEFLLFGAVLTALPFLLVDSFALAAVLVGAVITTAEVASVAVSAANGRFARRASNRLLVAAGFGWLGVGFVAAWLAPTPVLVGVAMLAVGAGIGLVLPSVDAELSGAVSDAHRAGALSLRNSTTFLGRASGPVVFAGLAATTGYQPLLLAAGVAAFLVAAVSLSVPARPVPEDIGAV
ncbi:MFS transporter [Halobium salinum]|uniref:MFS transporter n=1 Tax=Halobium salinum TaxID=1364940 RepID=A0ABD5PEU4_9EURY|nr:MFS transporter [Halobium salinum]